jgi:hypothetical protein
MEYTLTADPVPRRSLVEVGKVVPGRSEVELVIRGRAGALGGSLYECDACGALDYAYHSCRKQHCPECQDDPAQT